MTQKCLKTKSQRFFLHPALLFFISIFFTLLFSEAILQAVNFPKRSWSPWIEDKHTGYRFASFLDQLMITEEYQASIKTNEVGLRDDPIGEKKRRRFLLLGDSFAFGYGVNRPEIFPDLLESKLNVEILNAATGGFDLIHQLQYMKHKGASLQPDGVIYILYWGNDLLGNRHWLERGGNLQRTDRVTVRSHVDIKLLTLLRLMRHRFTFANKSLSSRSEWEPSREYLSMLRIDLDDASQKDYEYSKKLLMELAERVQQIGAKFYVFLLPYKTAVEEDSLTRLRSRIPDFDQLYNIEQPRKKIVSWLESFGIPYRDLAPPLQEAYQRSGQSLYFFKDGHLNQQGHKIVAEIIAKKLHSVSLDQ